MTTTTADQLAEIAYRLGGLRELCGTFMPDLPTPARTLLVGVMIRLQGIEADLYRALDGTGK